MTMTMLPSAEAPVATTDATSLALTASRATTFLRAQTQWLQRGLNNSGDRVAVGIVLGAHDRSHDRWVNLIRIVGDRLGEDVATQVAALYGFFGRVAESLERGAMESLCPEVASQGRRFIADHLEELTEAAVESVWIAAATEA